MNLGKKYHLWTMGCQMNEADSRHLASQLETIGYSPTTTPDEADLVVLNTCVVRQQAEDRIYGRLGSLKTVKEKKPHLTIGLMGCMVGTKEAPRLKKQYPYVDVFMPPSDTGPLFDYLKDIESIEEIREGEHQSRLIRDQIQDAINLLPLEQRGKNVTAFVPVVLGCSHACSFCIIPYRRGVERSRPPDQIFHEVKSLVAQGIREVMLLGQIVDRYGLDFSENMDLADLLKNIHSIEGLERIRFLTSHPNWMTDKLIHTVDELPKVCPHFEIPVQAGDDEVLSNMRRGYTIESYHQLIHKIRDVIPDATINTDIIVGFPGETEQQFMNTCQLISEVKFDKVHISKYSARPKTVATRTMVDNISDDDKTRRRNSIDEIQRNILVIKNKSLMGKNVVVLVEGKQKGRWRGRTSNNNLVFFEDDRDRLGQLVTIKIDHTGPFSIRGKLKNWREAVCSL